MKPLMLSLFVFAFCGSLFFAAAQPVANYDALLAKGRGLLNEGNITNAEVVIKSAVALDGKRYEAHLLAALIAVKNGDFETANKSLATALSLAPAEKKESIIQLQQKLSTTNTTKVPPAATSVEKAPKGATQTTLSPEARRKLQVLTLILQDAENAKTPEDRRNLLEEHLTKSEEYLKADTTALSVWSARAAVAVELNKAHVGWEAGQKLKRSSADSSTDPKLVRVMAMLERKGWLGPTDPDLIVKQEQDAEIRQDEARKMAFADRVAKQEKKANEESGSKNPHFKASEIDPDQKQTLGELLEAVPRIKTSGACFEIRTCYPTRGKFDAMLKRFQSSKMIFQRHGFNLLGYTIEASGDAPEGKLIYVLTYPAKQREKRWANFRDDPEWRTLQSESERDGKLVLKLDSQFLK